MHFGRFMKATVLAASVGGILGGCLEDRAASTAVPTTVEAPPPPRTNNDGTETEHAAAAGTVVTSDYKDSDTGSVQPPSHPGPQPNKSPDPTMDTVSALSGRVREEKKEHGKSKDALMNRYAMKETESSSPPGEVSRIAPKPPPGPAPIRQPVSKTDAVAGSSQAEPGDRFETQVANKNVFTAEDRFSTFAVDVDTASYSVARRYLNNGALPPEGSVRIEEYVNYFKYAYAPPSSGAFAVNFEAVPSPFAKGHHLLRVGLQGKSVSRSQRKPAHLVFLMDTSGSMNQPDKLPLAKEAVKIAVRNLNENDTVAIVTYAGTTADVLPPTPATEREKIYAAVDSLRSSGGTAMGSGMERAYRAAVQHASGEVVSRVIVLTDGDTNIGPNLSAEAMLESIHKYVEEGVTLSTIGFGMGNYRDDLMEKLADKGNGNCFYIDSEKEARKVFEEKLTGTLEVIAKDVKVQVEFNPQRVKSYRLLGYENRDIADKDFRNDKVDAGEIGAGHSVTALYDLELASALDASPADLATVRIRAKEPNGAVAKEQAFGLGVAQFKKSLQEASADTRFAVAVAGTADIFRHNPAAEGWTLATAEQLAVGATDGREDRREFVSLLRKAIKLESVGHSVATGR